MFLIRWDLLDEGFFFVVVIFRKQDICLLVLCRANMKSDSSVMGL